MLLAEEEILGTPHIPLSTLRKPPFVVEHRRPMALQTHSLDSRLASLDKDLGKLRADLSTPVGAAIDRWRGDAAALRFHLRDATIQPPLVAILGGTGTGKSTLLNRLLEGNLSGTSFRRTYTAGAVAITSDPKNLPDDWLGVEHRVAAENELPARGTPDALLIVISPQELASRQTLIDTPDLDGDQPLHHTQADRAFRWAQAVLFVVTPEKYQMTELLPYYRLARRYALPALFAMNKCEETAVIDDYSRQLAGHEWPDAKLFAIARDDAAWNPPPEADLSALRASLRDLPAIDPAARESGIANRAADLLGRLSDQVISPLRDDRREADRIIGTLRAMETPEPGVDVNPMTQQLQRRLQQRSVLYLMGPGRMMERVRQVPGLIVRLPRTLWDTVIRGKSVTINLPQTADQSETKVPDFRANLVDQFAVVQSRIDDALRSNPIAEKWLKESSSYASARIDPQEAGKIVDEELGQLREWLEKRWNATPRDTLLIMKLLRHLPGGKKLVEWAEATPYLLALIVATHHAFFGHVDLMVIGGFSLATWLTEKLSNEVTNRVRATNRRIGERFGQLAHRQIEKVSEWLARQAPPSRGLLDLEKSLEELNELVQHENSR